MERWKDWILSCIWGPLLVVQILLVIFFGFFNLAKLDLVMYIGWVIWGISMVLAWLPIIIFKKRGKVPSGKGYVHTTVLVDSGLYSIVRHPQYTAGILFSFALILLSQSWIILAMGAVVISLLYVDIVNADKHEIEKFGDEYIEYMKRVPRSNFLLGIGRKMMKRNGK